jgi:hypothetical protein
MIPWWIAALFFSIGVAGYISVNQQFKLPAHILAVWRGFGVGVLMLPFVFSVAPPQTWKFYILAVLCGFCAGYYDNRAFLGSAKFGGGVISRLRSLSVIFASIFWWMVKPEEFLQLIQKPLILSGVIACLLGCVIAMFLIRKAKVDKEAFWFFFPSIIVAALSVIFAKFAIVEAELSRTIPYYIFIVSLVSGLMNLLIHCKNKKCDFSEDKMFSKKSMIGGLVVVMFMIIMMFFRNYSLAYVPNPAYVSVIGYSSVIWIILFNKFKGVKDETNVFGGMLFVVSAVSLILLSMFY